MAKRITKAGNVANDVRPVDPTGTSGNEHPSPVPQVRAGRPRSASSGGQVQSLARALSLLNQLAVDDQGMTLTEISQTVGLAPSTAHRLLTTLQQDRFVQFHQDSGLWTVGVQAFVVGSAFVRSRDLVIAARPFMRRLMEDSGETVNLAVHDKGEAIYLAQVESRKTMRAIARPGGRVPLHSSGIGKALLAALSDDEVKRLVTNRGLIGETNNTLTSLAALASDLAAIRKRGYAFDDEENAVGLRCVAAVIYDEFARPWAGVSVSGPAARVTDDRLGALGQRVAETARTITAELGGQTPQA